MPNDADITDDEIAMLMADCEEARRLYPRDWLTTAASSRIGNGVLIAPRVGIALLDVIAKLGEKLAGSTKGDTDG